MNSRLTIRQHGRAIAVVGALVAVGATTTMALVAGTASAAPTATQPGKCIDNVNVRADASTTSKIVAVCETGQAVKVAETRDGFVHLTDLKGWAAQEYVSVDGKTAPAPPSRATPTTTAPAAADDPAADAPDTTAPGDEGTGPAARAPGTTGNDLGNAGDSDTATDDTADNTAPDASGQDATDATGDDRSGDQGSGSTSPIGGLLG